METESSLIKQRRFDLSMSKRTRKSNITMVAVEVNTHEEKLLILTPVTSQEKKEEEVLSCMPDNGLLKETVFAPKTPRPSLKELMQVNKERDAIQVGEQDLVKEKVPKSEKEANTLTGIVKQHQIVTAVKPPSMVRRCTKALNQMIKVRYASKQKNTVPLIAT